MSPNGKYIAYYDTLRDKSKTLFIIYDIGGDSDRVFFEMPPYDSARLEFSPDGNKLAVVNVSYPHRQSLNKEGVYIFDLATMKSKFFPYPRDAKLPQEKVMGSSVAWSSDGKRLYLAFNGHLSTGHLREYHMLDVKKGIYSPSDGVWEGGTYTFMNAGKPVNQHRNHLPQSTRSYTRLQSSDKQYIAHIDRDNALRIDTSNKKTILVAKGDYDMCEGVTIRILSWLPQSNYLVYENHRISYVYDVTTGKKATLFDSSKIGVFGWYD